MERQQRLRIAIQKSGRLTDHSLDLLARCGLKYSRGPYWRGIVGWYIVRVADPDEAVAVARAIDAEFANSASETRTQTESAFAAAFVGGRWATSSS